MGARVPVLDPNGRFATIDEADVPNLPLGARVLSSKEIAEKESSERYAAQSTAEKVGSVAGLIGPVPFAVRAGAEALSGHAERALSPTLPPTVEAYKQGVSEGFTGGLAGAAEHEAIRALGGQKAAEAYAKNVQQVREAHPIAAGAGTVAGLAGGAVAGGPLTGAGGLAEAGATRGLAAAGATGESVLGRVALRGAGMAARGATEGAVYGAAHQVSEDMLGDRQLAADKIFAATGHGALYGAIAGGLLGAGGSLAEEAAIAAAPRVRSTLAKVMEKADEHANDFAWKAAGGAGKDAEAGQVLLRRGVIPTEEGILAGAVPKAQMLPRIEAELGVVGDQISKLAPKGIPAVEISNVYDKAIRRFASDPVAAKAIADQAAEVGAAVGAKPGGTVTLGDIVKATHGRELAGLPPEKAAEITGHIANEISGVVAKNIETKGLPQLAGLMGDFQQLSKARQAALAPAAPSVAQQVVEGAAHKAGQAAGGAIGHAIGGPVGGFVGMGLSSGRGMVAKAAGERADAAVAYALHKTGSLGALGKVISKMDGLTDQAARGMLRAPKAAPLSESFTKIPMRARAMDTIARVHAIQADPEAHAARISHAVDPIAQSAPEISSELSRRYASAAGFLATKVPETPPPDPLNPREPPRLSDAEVAKLARYSWYVEKPDRFFKEAAHGQLTYEGAEVARELMPGAFDDLRLRVASQLADLMARGVAVPRAQRERIGMLLDIPAVPAQRDEHRVFLQTTVQPLPAEQQQQTPAPKPLPNKTEPTQLDRIEAS